MSFTVVYDTNVPFPAPLRALLIRLAMTGIVRARWTDEILDEVFRNILARRPDLEMARLARTRRFMNAVIGDVVISGYEELIPALALPDSDDRPVLAAAIHWYVQAIITHNLRDLPAAAVEACGIEALDPDPFVLDTTRSPSGRGAPYAA